ncbi:MAG: L-lactate permease [Pseudomonas sp.]|uniref:L-lactate permease n=1 Tax=Pseudomonas sp. TaxID=306 RepID=UPI0033921379
MPALSIALAFSPIALCGVVILLLRRSAVIGALAGIALAALLIALDSRFELQASRLLEALGATAILTLSAALVIVPGLYLNATLRGQGILDDLVEWIQALPLSAEHKALMLLLGLLPAIEALTGFGVSLFLGVPIFFRLFAADQAYRLSMLGMNIMPWGTLALATVVGASLSGTALTPLGSRTALTSALVFPLIGLVALFVIGGVALLRKQALWALAIGGGLSAALYLFNRLGLTETAGILAGALMGLLAFLCFRRRSETAPTPPNPAARARKFWMFLPYVLVLVLILLTRTVPVLHDFLAQAWVLSSARIKLSVLASPGIVLALVCLFLQWLRPATIDHRALWSRVRIACLGLLCFILLAQVMNAAGMVAAISTALQQWTGDARMLLLLAPALGMFSGFITGSNLSGNALLINVQQQIGEQSGQGLLFAALQNSAAGHSVFTSLPIIVLIMTIARDADKHAQPSRSAEHDLLNFGLKTAVLVYLALVTAVSLLSFY